MPSDGWLTAASLPCDLGRRRYDGSMAGMEPGDRPPKDAGRPARHLDRAPGERYARHGAGHVAAGAATDADRGEPRQALVVPLVKAATVALVGAGLLYEIGALLSSNVGLVFVAGLTGAAIGLLLARAAAPGGGDLPGLTRRQALWLAVGLTVAAVVLGAVGTWLHALGEGGALGPIDYLLETFGIIVPGELVVGSVAAAWGASAGPVQG